MKKRRSLADALAVESATFGRVESYSAYYAAPVVDSVGSDLVFPVFFPGYTAALVAIDGDLSGTILPSVDSASMLQLSPAADLDGDGLYEYFVGTELINPRTGEVLGSLNVEHGGVVQAISDIDGDGHAEIIAEICEDTECVERDIVAYEGDNLAMSPVAWHLTHADRSGLEYGDGLAVPAGQYPPPTEFNTINVPEFSARREAYGVDLQLAFANVCIDECDRDRMPVWITVANRGVTDLIRPVEVKLVGTYESAEHVLDAVVIDALPSGRQTEALAMKVPAEWVRATDLRLELMPVGRPLWACGAGLPVEEFEGATCAE